MVLLASAFSKGAPRENSIVADVSGMGGSALGRAAPRLASALRASSHPFVLMLDDLQELKSPACHDVLSVALSGVPPGSQVVTASRAEQPHLHTLRASGEAMELSASDLALDARGAEQVFASAHVPLTPEQARLVIERTEGWPAGLQLAAMIARDTKENHWTVSGDDRYVADYLYREALSQLDGATQRFLRRTAVLDQLHGSLCDALLGGSDGRAMLRALEGSNAFLVPLDRRREWYRYHALFREFLLAELRRVEPEVVVELHLRAADWYEARGTPAIALEHLLDTTERDRCVQLATELALSTYSAGQLSTVQRWLATLGEEAITAYPPLAVVAGWVAALTGQTVEAQRWADVVQHASFDLPPRDGTASFASARAMLRAGMCASGPEQMMADAGLAVSQEPAWSPRRATALYLLAEAHLLTGNVAGATILFQEASDAAIELGDTDTIVLSESHLAFITMDQDRWGEAADRVALAVAVVEENRMHDYAASVLAFAAAARLALHDGAPDEVERQLTRAMRARPAGTFALPTWAVFGRLHLGKVYWANDDQATARHLLREIEDILLHRPTLGALVDEVATLRTMIAAHTDSPLGTSPLSPAELRVLPYLQTHLTYAEIGARLFISRNTVRTEVASIYRKLGVSSRNEAVERATATGLLGA